MTKTIEELIAILVGEEAVEVAKILLKHKEIIDEQIIEELGEQMTIKDVRRSLYKLNNLSLARYRRIRDQDTGYFVYWWRLQRKRLKDMIIQRRRKILNVLKQRLQFEKENLYYTCGFNKEGCQPMDFELAFEHDFICPVCGKEMDQVDNEDTIEALEEKIHLLEAKIDADLQILDE